MSTNTTDSPICFTEINPETIEAQLDALLIENKQKIRALTDNPKAPLWDNVIAPLLDLDDALEQFWAPISHLNAVAQTPALREAVVACQPKLTNYHTEIGQDQALYQVFQSIHSDATFTELSEDKQQYIKNTLIDFEHSGIALPLHEQQQFKKIKSRLSELSTQFANQLLDATAAWSITLDDKSALAGLPEDDVARFAEQARDKHTQGYRITLTQPDFLAVMRFAQDRSLRETVYHAFVTRASEVGPNAGQYDNGPIMDELLSLRHQMAQLLGYQQYSELSLRKKMAESVEQVEAFLQQLAEHARPKAREELAELTAFAEQHSGIIELQAWDVPYFSELKRQHDLNYSEQELKPYLPVDQVIDGMFAICQQLFGIRFEQVQGVDSWHPDVRSYQLYDQENQPRAGFYLDLYAREHKRSGAWMADARQGGRRADGQWQTPIAFLTCNFSPPAADGTALLTHSEVTTLFHEFGHGLHHMLTCVDTFGVSGINGVAWDAVELPSQFLENWCWTRESLDLFARHYQTQEPLPEALFAKLQQTRLFHVGMGLVRQLEFSLFDLRLHSQYDSENKPEINTVLNQVRAEVAVVFPPEYNRFANGFAHIFAGGYAAGYYSYKWAEVLSADAFGLFRSRGIMDQPSGLAFREQILERGGSRPAMDLFVHFRGRKPDPAALLREYGFQT